jgi:hypothetical protein
LEVRVADPSHLSLWLGIIAIATSLQVLMLIGAGIIGLRLYRQASGAIELFQREQLTPIVTRVNTALDDVHEVMGRVKTADENVRRVIERTGERAGQAATRVRAGFWPVVGLGRGVWAAMQAFSRRRHRFPGRLAGSDGEARFAYEGGTYHVRS